MIIIYSAAAEAFTEIERLMDAYDAARDDGERDQLAEQIFRLAAPDIGKRLQNIAKGRLNPDQVQSLAWQALMRGLNESGMTKFKRLDGSDWEAFVQKLKAQQTPMARHIWTSLDADTRKKLSEPYLKATAIQTMLNELNALLSTEGFFDPQQWQGVALNDEAKALQQKSVGSKRGLARFNAAALQSAFPELRMPPQPDKNLIGYLTRGVLQQMRPRIQEEISGKKPDEYMMEVYNGVKTDIADVDRLNAEGRLPEEWEGLSRAEQVYRHQKQRLEKTYAPVIAHWNQWMQKILGSKAFTVGYAAAVTRAKAILLQHPEIAPRDQWEKRGSPYFLPLTAVAPYGMKSIQRMLGASGTRSLDQAKEFNVQPAAPQQGPSAQQMESVQNAGDPQMFMALADQLYNRPGYEVEHAVAGFMASNPNPNPQQVQQFLATQPPDISETIHDVGWNEIVKEIEQKIMSHVQEQSAPAWAPQPAVAPAQQPKPTQQRQRAVAPVAPAYQEAPGLEEAVPKLAAIIRRGGRSILISRQAMLLAA